MVIGKEIYGEELKFDPVGVIDYENLLHKKLKESKSVNFDDRSLSYDLASSH